MNLTDAFALKDEKNCVFNLTFVKVPILNPLWKFWNSMKKVETKKKISNVTLLVFRRRRKTVKVFLVTSRKLSKKEQPINNSPIIIHQSKKSLFFGKLQQFFSGIKSECSEVFFVTDILKKYKNGTETWLLLNFFGTKKQLYRHKIATKTLICRNWQKSKSFAPILTLGWCHIMISGNFYSYTIIQKYVSK